MSLRAASVAGLLCLGLGTFPRDARAQTIEQPLAQSLFDEGRALMEAGKYAEACAKLTESQRLDPAAGTQANLAVCHEKEGKTATAWAEFNTVLSQALKDNRRDREKLAREHIATLAPKLPRVTLIAPPVPVEGLVVEIDGVSFASVAWGVATPLNPGTHEIRAHAPGKLTWTRIQTLREADDEKLQIPALTGAPVADGSREIFIEHQEPTFVPPPLIRTELSPVFYVAGAAAIAGYGTAIVAGILAVSAHNQVRDKCLTDRQFCIDPDGKDAASRAGTLAWVSTVALGVGVAGTVTALFWPRRRVAATTTGMQIAPAPGGVALSGHF